MKIEKINDNQIRCTLNSDDLATRQIKLSELAYGSEKAKNLFRDMMIQAQDECGFEADNLPLMIEAIPITADSIVLIITKVEDPEELDTRFSKFAPSLDDDSAHTPDIPAITGADDILDIFQKLCEGKLKKSSGTKKEKKSPATQPKTESTDEGEKPEIIRIFHFSDLDGVIDASRGLNNCYDGENTLYRDAAGQYLLVLHQAGCTPEDFNKVCNILSEYGRGKACTPAREAFLGEHGETIAKGRALQDLFQLA
ncbi:MAG TPA: adaptor protein MecA [Candidatus Pullilachnospira stercoravium]|uniref:Adaptor protein MecA n=1 Tax=Candidatus Pullilachnospira stercoravium TaxID=2840913 RepID=A0A9D1NTT9_9FIRM|nr:adaptor protein MecA [Candidatus Pullilachnospira stercoravium]